MNKNRSIALALVAGFLGGLLTRYVGPPAAFAQDQTPVAKEIRAQSFTIVDASNRAVGTFMIEPAPRGAPYIVLRDSHGHQIWSAGGNPILPLAER